MSAPVQLGCRWQPGAIERRDSTTGVYEAVNPLCLTQTQTDLDIQRALLKPVRSAAVARGIEQARAAIRVAGALQ